jgi:hypothetical protein
LKAGALKLKTFREVLILQGKIKKKKQAFGWLTFGLLERMRHEAWTDKTLKEIFDASLEKVRELKKEQAPAWKIGNSLNWTSDRHSIQAKHNDHRGILLK